MKFFSDRRTRRWIGTIAGRTKLWILALTGIRVLQGAIGVLYAYCLKSVVDSAASGIADGFGLRIGLFGGLILLSVILNALGRYILDKSRVLLERSLRNHAFSALIRRDYAAVSGVHSGQWLNRITSDAQVIAGAATSLAPELCGTAVRLLSALAALIVMLPSAALILLPCGIIMVLFSWMLRKKLKKLHNEAQQADGTSRAFMQERLAGLLVLRTFGQESTAAKEADALNDRLAKSRMRRAVFSNLSGTAVGAALMGAQFLGIVLCGWGILNGSMTYGSMSAVLYLVNMLEAPFARLSGYLSQYYAMIASAERLMEIDALPGDCAERTMQEHEARRFYRENFQSLTANDLTFRYGSDDAVLSGCSFTVKKGQFAAFSGTSGAGKSTAMKLLLSLYQPESGEIFVTCDDGTTRPLDAALRSLFAYVPQGNLLLSGTVREAVCFACRDSAPDDAAVMRALAAACADDFISTLPDGLDTVLGEGGSGLSEGQQQRLSIARAILSGRPILLLDEATSALDAATEERLLNNLRSMTDRTVIIITHRPAARKICDQEIRFENRRTE